MKPLSKETLVRANWCRALRKNGDRQCIGYYRVTFYDPRHTPSQVIKVCATGLLLEQLKIPCGGSYVKKGDIEKARKAAGLSMAQWNYIVNLNDHQDTFDEIADAIERLPYAEASDNPGN